MIENAYCSYEVSKLLKEKGFDENTTFYYIDGDKEKYLNHENLVGYDGFYPCPTHQMAMSWLRNKKIYIQIRMSFNTYTMMAKRCSTSYIKGLNKESKRCLKKYVNISKKNCITHG